ncbi:ubiquitin carboxyl-terminal hydrolase [Candidatus Rhabdochlamydia sp. T3358]|uniref:ubiquitin carboxyl-terminal hydrolase n=1 Tax=Candidatus Rhabdochlamydia sp. T3358 TaxID=2099795 RepID=UPI0010B95F67|nr:ubiquitin carboxyl-terminal hydrolase [Candidatus Rhabdochlamydia sp. T3358]VHO02029.1 Ubiquitin carboxyl-terminal hydrolase [Candidatus Rhabdochlamydia sp. T3358]
MTPTEAIKSFSYPSLGDQVQKITWQLYNDPLCSPVARIILPRLTGTLIHSVARICDCVLTLLPIMDCISTATYYKTINLVYPIQDCEQATNQLFERAMILSDLFFSYLIDIPTCWVFNLISPQDYQELFSTEGTISWTTTSISPIPGFENRAAANCAFNSCLQVILHHPEWRGIYEVVANHYKAKTEKEDKACGENMLAVLHTYDTALTVKKSIPAEISHKLRLATHHLNPLIAGDCSQQEDAHEIFAILIEKYEAILKETINLEQALIPEEQIRIKKEHLLHTSPIHFENKVTKYYELGEEVEKTKDIPSSLSENNTLTKTEIEWQLKIELNANKEISFSELLQKFFNGEEKKHVVFSENSPKLMKDGKCIQIELKKEEQEFSKKPNYLAIQFARFTYTEKGPSKIQTPITSILEQLDATALSIKSSASGIYELTSFITHRGSTNGGHYIAYLKKEAEWIKCDDETTSYANKSSLSEDLSNSYMCFYKLKTD